MDEQQENMYDFPISQNYNKDYNSLAFMLDTEDIIERIRHTLKNEYFDAENNKWAKRLDSNGKPEKQIINDFGIMRITGLLNAIVTKQLSLSDMDEFIIKEFTHKLALSIIKDVSKNYLTYGLEGKNLDSNMDFVYYAIIYNVYPAFARSEDGTTIRAITKIQHSIERKDITGEKKKGFFPSFPNIFGKKSNGEGE